MALPGPGSYKIVPENTKTDFDNKHIIYSKNGDSVSPNVENKVPIVSNYTPDIRIRKLWDKS